MLVDTRTKSLLLRSRDPFKIRSIIPTSRVLDHPTYTLAVKHTEDTTRVLRNVGIQAPAPIRHYYDWPGKFTPGEHQIVMAEFLTMHRRGFNLSEMGTEKTAASLWAADWLMRQKQVRKAVIASPLSTLERVWLSEIFSVLMHRRAVIVHGSREQRLKALDVDVDFYIINHDGLCLSHVQQVLRSRNDIDLIIVDEASAYCNASTRRYKSLQELLSPQKRLWVLTGTPCANEPSDAWALARLVNPDNTTKYFGTFRRMTMVQVSPYRWLPRNDAMDVVYKALQPAVRFQKKDCKNLPPLTIIEHTCQLTKEQLSAIDTMRREMYIDLKTNSITAVNAADRITKLRQIMCGAIKDPKTGEYVPLDYKPRLEVLLDCIAQANAKVFVVVPFKGITEMLAKDIESKYTVAVLNGDVSPSKRNKIIVDFKTTPNPHVLLCHPQVMAHGLNLTEADVCVFYAPIYSNDQAQQVVERFNRSGQTRPMTVVRMGAHKLEWDIYDKVDGKSRTQQSVLDMYIEALTK